MVLIATQAISRVPGWAASGKRDEVRVVVKCALPSVVIAVRIRVEVVNVASKSCLRD
jgi:hypothetical protein